MLPSGMELKYYRLKWKQGSFRSNPAVHSLSRQHLWSHHCFYEIRFYLDGRAEMDVKSVHCDEYIRKEEVIDLLLKGKCNDDCIFQGTGNIV